LGLAKAYLRLGKHSAGVVVCEDLTRAADPPAAAFVLLARLLLTTGEPDRAAAVYRQGVEADEAVADADLEAELGVGAGGGYEEDIPAGRVPASGWAADGGESAEIERPKITFADVGGMEAVKEEIRLK